MTETTTATGGLVYGIRLRREVEYRYVGITTKTASRRFHQHLRVAAEGRKTPFYDWLRKHDRSEVIADELDWIEGLPELGQAEIDWISYLRREGDRLLNLSEGGMGPTGVVWTEEMREAARIRSTGRTIVRESGPGASFYGKSHSIEQRQKWSEERIGMSAVRKGRSMPSSQRSAHTRHHTNKGVEKADCRFCVEDSAKPSLSSESESES